MPLITRRALFEVWRSNTVQTRNKKVLEHVTLQLGLEDCSEDIRKSLEIAISKLCSKISERWQTSTRCEEKFLKRNELWLSKEIEFEEKFPCLGSSTTNPNSSSITKVGRPRKLFSDASVATKRRQVKTIVDTATSSELVAATQKCLRDSGKRNAAKIVAELSLASPQRATRLLKAREEVSRKPRRMNGDQALALMIDLHMSTNQYKEMRENALEYDCELYPPYHVVKEAKEKCYPPKESVEVTEQYVEIKLQALLDLTVSRLCAVRCDVLESIETDEIQCVLISKWGCDGSTDQSCYKQRYYDSEYQSDENIFSVSLVPLQLYSDTRRGKNIIWQNARSSSTRFCRPIKVSYVKENQSVIREEMGSVRSQIEELVPSTFSVTETKTIVVTHKLLCTMVDGKVCNSLSQYTSSQKCYICGATPKEMNVMDCSKYKQINPSMLEFGLSPLHTMIRFFECLLHISYRLEVKIWAVRSDEDKKIVEARKKYIQQRFQKEMGLIIDRPKKGYGNSNDGNTARRFFKNETLSAAITGIHEDLIHRFKIILETLACGHEINKLNFGTYVKITKELYLKHYNWYYMPVSVHKVLVHGEDVIDSNILPIGQLSEEAQEARNKDYRRFRECFSRKSSRLNTNTDLFHRLLVSSDPFVSSIRKSPKTKSQEISDEAKQLLCFENFQELPSTST